MVWEKGISGHVNCFSFRDHKQKLRKITYFTFINQCNQDMVASISVFKYDLEQSHIDFPGIKSLHCRNDSAGCYSGAPAIIAKREIYDSVGI